MVCSLESESESDSASDADSDADADAVADSVAASGTEQPAEVENRLRAADERARWMRRNRLRSNVVKML